MGKLGDLWQIGRIFGVRNTLRRFGYEFERRSGLISRRMRSVAGWQSWDLQRIAPDTTPEEFLSSRRCGKQPFFFSLSQNLAPNLKLILGATGEESLIAEANRILQGDLPFFGRLSFAGGFPPRWFENPVTRQRVEPTRSWTTMRFASDDYGDLKLILEPSRFLFMYTLARAYAVSGDERFSEAFWIAIESWAASSPPMSGPLWICGQECSLRILAWSFALYAFLHSPQTTPQRAALLLSMIAAHAWRTMQTVGYARSQRSNHLFSEAVGLWTAGVVFPELKEAAQWRDRGARLLREAVFDQITPEGVHLQDSFNYQRMVLHLLLWTIRLAEIHQRELDPAIKARATAAFRFIAGFVDAKSGSAPNHGSNDGSNILPLAACDFGDFRPLLRLGGCILNQPVIRCGGPWDEAALWLCGLPMKSACELQFQPAGAVSAAAGYHRIGTRNSWVLVRAGRNTHRPFQADQLHVDLWWHGHNLTRDAGTYLYNGEPPWDNGLAGTAVHNTVMVDGRDQMRRAGRFLWLDKAQAPGRSFSTGAAALPNVFEGEHDGYRHLGIVHRRKVQCVTEDAWAVVDDLLGSGQHETRLHWLLPDCPFELKDASVFCGPLPSELAGFRCSIFSMSTGSTAVIYAGKLQAGRIEGKYKDEDKDDEQLLGWISPTYSELSPATSLVYSTQALLPLRIVTVILVAGEELNLRQSGQFVILSRSDVEIYRVSLSPHGEPSYNCEL